jgi:hypothetical protein
MLRQFRGNDIRTALRTLVTNHSSHGHFPRFRVLKLPARHCKAVTRGTPKSKHRQAAALASQHLLPAHALNTEGALSSSMDAVRVEARLSAEARIAGRRLDRAQLHMGHVHSMVVPQPLTCVCGFSMQACDDANTSSSPY